METVADYSAFGMIHQTPLAQFGFTACSRSTTVMPRLEIVSELLEVGRESCNLITRVMKFSGAFSGSASSEAAA